MGEKPDQIEQEIAETRSELNHNFNALEDKLKSYVDWRAQFKAHPAALLALAFGGGAVLAAIFPPRIRSRHTGSRLRERLNDLRPNIAERESWPNLSSAASSEPPQSRTLWGGPDIPQSALNGEENFTGSTSRGFFRTANGYAGSQPSEARQNLNAFASAFLGVGVRRLSQYIDSLLPGFRNEFERTRTERRETGSPRA